MYSFSRFYGIDTGVSSYQYIYLSGKPPEEVFVLEESIIDELLSGDPRKIEGALNKIKRNPKLLDDEIITKLMDDRDKNVRGKAAEALGIIKNPKAVVALIEALKKDEEASVRGEAAGALGSIGDAEAVASLKEALKDRSPTVRLYAKNALDEIKTKQKSK
ncbi:MAG: hypothetical protein GH149_00455 [Methanosarcinales archaeon]|nr:hypothetical protein [Methanosarcinales archaeon]